MHQHVIASAKIIPTQHLAPDISQAHVMKLLSEKMWTLKQIFCHFSKQSLTEVRCFHTMKTQALLSTVVVTSRRGPCCSAG